MGAQPALCVHQYNYILIYKLLIKLLQVYGGILISLIIKKNREVTMELEKVQKEEDKKREQYEKLLPKENVINNVVLTPQKYLFY